MSKSAFDRKYVWNIYRDEINEWRWNKRSRANLKIVGASTEGYKRKKTCVENMRINGFKGTHYLISKEA